MMDMRRWRAASTNERVDEIIVRFWQIVGSHGHWWAMGWMRSVLRQIERDDYLAWQAIFGSARFQREFLLHPVIVEMAFINMRRWLLVGLESH